MFGKKVVDQYLSILLKFSMTIFKNYYIIGITGKGVVVALIDDGLDMSSEDLAPNYVGYNSLNEEIDAFVYSFA